MVRTKKKIIMGATWSASDDNSSVAIDTNDNSNNLSAGVQRMTESDELLKGQCNAIEQNLLNDARILVENNRPTEALNCIVRVYYFIMILICLVVDK